MVERLSREGETLDPSVLRMLLERGDFNDDVLRMLNKENITGFQELLFEALRKGDTLAEIEIIKTLARLNPVFLREKLHETDLPLWMFVFCLRELGINGSAVGRSDLSREILAANLYTLDRVGEVIGGNEFHAICAMEDPDHNKDMVPLFPLFEPTLAGPDSTARRAIVALMRTFGEKVRRSGKSYILEKGSECCPVLLGLTTDKTRFRLGEPVTVSLVETARADSVWLCLKGNMKWRIGKAGWPPDQFSLEVDSFFGKFDNVDLPREDFHLLHAGETFLTQEDVTMCFDRPGHYQFQAMKLYPHDGGSVGIDAWTGTVFSSLVQIEIYD
ncbi:MAG: hypothetical protein RDV48_30780 [Candidatus Eremiobacteraeota bacterium]|nr:hypothetical protein [Candidatus Eremiobacteraeota bacterium]